MIGVSTCEDAAEEAEEGLDSALGCGAGRGRVEEINAMTSD